MSVMRDSSGKGTVMVAALLVLLFSVVFYSLFLLHQQRERRHLQQVTQQQTGQLQSIIYSQEKMADMLFENLFEKSDAAKIMSLADKADESEKEGLRLLLWERFSSHYDNLQKYGVQILHFHLPRSISFLRFHNPDVYGDSLQGDRYSIDLVNETRQPVHGFEEGRILHGFRNVYPLFYDNEFVGTVEISFNFLAIRELAVRLFPAIHTLILHEEVICNSVMEQEQERYIRCKVSPVYRKNRKVVGLIQQELPGLGIITLDELAVLNDELSSLVAGQLARHETFSIAKTLQEGDRVFVTSFLPVQNVRGTNVGYFVSYRNAPTLQGYNQRYRQVRLVVLLITCFSFAGVFFYSRQIRKGEKYQALATVDGLTGLANRLHFDLVLEQAVRQGQRNNEPFSLAIFDIDDFKKVNDTYGHDGGDKTLVQIGDTVRSNVRDQDMVARWGGEEFVVLLPETAVGNAAIVLEKLRQLINKIRVQSGGQVIQVTCSFGVAQFRKEMQADTLLKAADQALYRAKAGGKDCVVTAD